MKRFLLQHPENKKWVEAAEKRQKSKTNVDETARLVRREMFPQLRLETIESSAYPSSMAANSSSIPHEIVIEARQRHLFRLLMKELLSTTKCVGKTGKKTSSLYRTSTWEQKSKAIFFYFHNSLGNLNL